MAVNLFVARRRRRRREPIFHHRRTFNEVLVDFEVADYRLSQIIIEQLISGFAESHFYNVCALSHTFTPEMQVNISKLN